MKNKICTSIEQSKKLIELGINIETADMYWVNAKVDANPNWLPSFVDDNSIDTTVDLPAWSLSALLELMPPYLFEFERGIDLNIYRHLNGKRWHCSYMPNNIESMKKDKFRQITHGDTSVDAVFTMICWLLKNKKI